MPAHKRRKDKELEAEIELEWEDGATAEDDLGPAHAHREAIAPPKKSRTERRAEKATAKAEKAQGHALGEGLREAPAVAATAAPETQAPSDEAIEVGLHTVREGVERPGVGTIHAPESEAVQATGPQTPDAEAKALLKALRRQADLRLKAEIAEAQRMQEKAKELTRDAKLKQKRQKEVSSHFEFVRNMAEELGFDPERPITELPSLEGTTRRDVETTTIQEEFSFARVLFDEKNNRYEYEVIEPQLTGTEKEVLAFLRDTLIRTMEARAGHDAANWETQLVEYVDRAILDHSILIDDIARQKVQYYLLRDFLGFGPIDVLMRDPMVEDISCDGPGLPIYMFHRQYESLRTNVQFKDELELDAYVIGLGQRSGKHISIAEPLLDATLPDGSRLQATLSREVTTRGSSFTIRRFRADPLTPPDLVRIGTMNPAMSAYFWFAMEEGNSIIYAGGTASGKTTTLNAMSLFIPPEKKVVSIEDTREINLPHENWIAGVTRAGFGGETLSGKRAGEVDMFKLLAAALRQRPEYLLVGEVRGHEALTLFQAMATGHATYSTVHADSVSSAVYRLENEPINVPRMMLQTANAFAVQVQARIGERMVRRIKEVVEIVGMDAETGDLLTNRVFDWDNTNDTHHYYGNSHILDTIRKKRNMTAHDIEEEWRNRTRIIRWMVETGIRKIEDVSNVISEYYSRPATLLHKVTDWEASRRGHVAVAHRKPDAPAATAARPLRPMTASHPNDPHAHEAAPGSPATPSAASAGQADPTHEDESHAASGGEA